MRFPQISPPGYGPRSGVVKPFVFNLVHRAVMRSSFNDFRVGVSFCGNVLDYGGVFIQVGARKGLGWFQSHWLRHNKGVMAGPEMEAEIHKAAADFFPMHAGILG